ncbi:ATP-binding protein [Nonomuraea basaltis]|uniref:ATP-binding protein n=1 Tax=Nonomuraea basaltis TaxID=2495887 RepID=UPI00110C5ED0|nr:ATP-binding protein [Nonomuraea basaltis]TMR88811.1 ATP/GTP-binding protein [Nonomuraea basaltis]
MVVADFGSFGFDDERALPATTLDGWRQFVNDEPLEFTLLADEKCKSLDEVTRAQYDEARMTYHSELIVVETSAVRQVVREGRLLTVMNKRERSARRGLIVSGQWATGKSTAIKQLGRVHELLVRQRFPGQDRIPVVYVTAPPKGSPKKLATQFAHFLGMPPFKSRANEMDIAIAVCEVLTEARCDLVILDEIHNVNMATSQGEDLSDHMKYFTEHLPATFIYAGINVESSGLFTGIRGQQLAARCVMTKTGKFPYNEEWKSMVATMEHALRLHCHDPGSLLKQARYLHKRTRGVISSLSHIIRASAICAIVDGREAVTRELMDTITVDHSSESGSPKTPRPHDDGDA